MVVIQSMWKGHRAKIIFVRKQGTKKSWNFRLIKKLQFYNLNLVRVDLIHPCILIIVICNKMGFVIYFRFL